ncbi:MAG: carbohydrate kinase family protein [Clostridia bacterium]|nr:carbohydrate kinase family protein [Clostridia bacterium]
MVDTIKKIDAYPDMGMLANVQSIEKAVGGCVPNTLINLARMETGIPLTAIGRMGDDEGGKFILDQLNASGADTEHIHIIPGGITGFSDIEVEDPEDIQDEIVIEVVDATTEM